MACKAFRSFNRVRPKPPDDDGYFKDAAWTGVFWLGGAAIARHWS